MSKWGYSIVAISNNLKGEEVSIRIKVGDPGWSQALVNYENSKPPTNSPEWNKGTIVAEVGDVLNNTQIEEMDNSVSRQIAMENRWGYSIIAISNNLKSAQSSIRIKVGDPGWTQAIINYENGKPPTNSPEWKKGMIVAEIESKEYYYVILEGKLIRSALLTQLVVANGVFFRYQAIYPSRKFNLAKIERKHLNGTVKSRGLKYEALSCKKEDHQPVEKQTVFEKYNDLQEKTVAKIDKLRENARNIACSKNWDGLISNCLEFRPKFVKDYMQNNSEAWEDVRDRIKDVKNSLRIRILINDYFNEIQRQKKPPGIIKRVFKKLKEIKLMRQDLKRTRSTKNSGFKEADLRD